MRGAWLICKKEFLELSKDRRTLFLTFAMPLLLYPLIFGMMSKLGEADSKRITGRASRVFLADPEHLLEGDLKARPDTFEVVPRPGGDLKQAIQDQKLDLCVEVPAGARAAIARQETVSYQIVVDRSEGSGRKALERFKELVAERDKAIVASRLNALHASPQLVTPSRFQETDIANNGLGIAKMMGAFLPYMLLVMMYAGAMQPGIYCTAGEKERGTLQSLLSTRLPRNQIILGKLLYIFAMGVIAALVNLVSMGFSFTRMVGPAMNAQASGASSMPLFTPGILVLSFLLMIPLGLLFSNVILFLGIQAKNTQEAGTAMAPGIFVVVFLGVFSMAPGLEKMLWVPYIPVMNVSLAIRKLFSQQGDPVQYLIALGTTLALAAFMTWLSTRVLDRESVIFKQS